MPTPTPKRAEPRKAIRPCRSRPTRSAGRRAPRRSLRALRTLGEPGTAASGRTAPSQETANWTAGARRCGRRWRRRTAGLPPVRRKPTRRASKSPSKSPSPGAALRHRRRLHSLRPRRPQRLRLHPRRLRLHPRRLRRHRPHQRRLRRRPEAEPTARALAGAGSTYLATASHPSRHRLSRTPRSSRTRLADGRCGVTCVPRRGLPRHRLRRHPTLGPRRSPRRLLTRTPGPPTSRRRPTQDRLQPPRGRLQPQGRPDLAPRGRPRKRPGARQASRASPLALHPRSPGPPPAWPATRVRSRPPFRTVPPAPRVSGAPRGGVPPGGRRSSRWPAWSRGRL